MAVLDIRHRTAWLVLAVVVGHVLLISSQVSSDRGVPVLEEVTVGLFSGAQRGSTSAIDAVRTAWDDYVALRGVRRENEALRNELARLQITLQRERALASRSRLLQRLLDMRAATPVQTEAARVIAGGARAEFRTLTIDKGTADGLQADSAVLAPDGVVGRVITPSRRAALVQLLIDRDAAAGALVERTRATGIVVGDGVDRFRLDHLPPTADILVGDRVVTSGIEGIYPPGFVIGRIESFHRRDGDGDYTDVTVRPAVDFTALEAVLVVVTPQAHEDP